MEKEISLDEEIFVPDKGWVKVKDLKLKNKICPYYEVRNGEITKFGLCSRRSRYNKPRSYPGMRGSVLYYNPKVNKKVCLLNEIPHYPLYLECPVFQGEKI